VTANFLTSSFILNEEVPRLLENHRRNGMRIIPVIGKPCAWKVVPWLADIQVRPKDGRPISAGDDNQIDTDLMLITYEVASLLDLIDDETMGEQLAHVSLGYTVPQRQYDEPQNSGLSERVERGPAAATIDTACSEITSEAKQFREQSRAVTIESIHTLIQLAVSYGVPIYNSGSRIGCAQIYVHAAKIILDLTSHQHVSAHASEARTIEAVKQALGDIDLHSISVTPENANDLAWKTRHTFDEILGRLEIPVG
jgi:hypothetical protein